MVSAVPALRRHQRRYGTIERVGNGAEEFSFADGDFAVGADAGRAGVEEDAFEFRPQSVQSLQSLIDSREIALFLRRQFELDSQPSHADLEGELRTFRKIG